ncbi:HPP family protein [Halothiobacillus sp. DCM-1]|uniref:CBS domain-containing protein n=1 Tax=Halothiobacillus sp. DCM-1 TaxID=3112558 RepID=UPI00325112E1
MSFVVFGPGVSDQVTLNQALFQPVMHAAPRAIEPVARGEESRATDDSLAQLPPRQHPAATPDRSGRLSVYDAVRSATDERRPIVLASQLMTTPVISLPPEGTIAELRAIFEQQGIGLVPVIDAQERLVGVVTKGDISRQRVRFSDLAPLSVMRIANPKVLTATLETNIRELARVLLAQDIRGLPIVDAERRVVGIVTRGDILRALVNYAPLELWS